MSHRFTSLSKIFLAALVVAFVVSALGATAAVAAPREVSPFGMNSHMLWGYSNSSIDKELDVMQAAGSKWLRIDVSWYGFEPVAKGSYDQGLLAKFDYIVNQAAAHGIEVAPVVLATPKWANDGISRWNPPTNDADFGDFMKFMAARYAGRVTYWELGNEVNETGFWNVPRASSPARYVSFLKAGYSGTKAGNADAKVITAGLAGADFWYVRDMYAAGAKGYFDVVGIHPYCGARSPYATDTEHPGWVYGGMENVKDVMDANGDADKTIWATELGWQTSTVNSHVTESAQAQYTYDAFKRLYEEFPYVTTIFVYSLRNDGTSTDEAIDNYGLLKRDYTAKPAYASYRQAARDFQAAPIVKATARTSRTSVRRYGRITLSGALKSSTASTPATGVAGVSLKVQRKSGTRWITVKTITTSSTGGYATRIRLSSRGSNYFRVRFVGNAETPAATSNSVRIRVY